jgi:Reverse transcriptase (RNA-dependent DNA polymerase)
LVVGCGSALMLRQPFIWILGRRNLHEGLEEYLNRDLRNKCVTLKKSIYGWYKQQEHGKKIHYFLQDIGFQKCPSDNCLMTRINEIGIVILCIYVDNVCCFGNKRAIEETIQQIENFYNIKRVRELSEFIGVNIQMKDKDLYLSQEDTLKRLEKKFLKTSNR